VTFRRIIVDATSRDALKLASVLQRAANAELVVTGTAAAVAEAPAVLPYGLAARLHPADVRAAANALRDLAEAEHADLIVVGDAPHAIAQRLLSSGPCAVAIAPRDFVLDPDPALRVIGVAFDGGPEAARAVEAARDLALSTGGAIRLIGVAEPATPPPSAGLAAMSGWAPPIGLMRERLQRDLEAQADALPARVRAQVILADGDPAREIVKRAGVLSLLVVGSRGFGPVRRVLLGSVSAPVVRAAPCPVLVVPRAAEAAAPAANAAAAAG
jgi:nucleotide-binding universal stress UspA family protein